MVSAESICFVYSATGPRFVDEALASAKSVKDVMPDVQRILYTDCLLYTSPSPRDAS